MSSLLKIVKDKRILIPIIFFGLLELFFQSGIYTPYLKKNSYAANINRITNHIIANKKNHNPNIIVLGTSVAYQGLSMRILQERIQDTNLKIQSSAIPGSELIIQELTSKKILDHFENINHLIYVAEVTMPWVIHTELQLPTLAMLGEFPLRSVLKTIPEHSYTSIYNIPIIDSQIKTNYSFSDYSFLLSKTIAYRRDVKDFILDPPKRIKHISRSFNNPNQNFYDFENDHFEKMSSYPMNSLEECIQQTSNFGPPYPENSNYDHKKAVFETCALTIETIKIVEPLESQPNANTEKSKLYFQRLRRVFEPYLQKNIKILVVFAPYSNVMGKLNGPKKMEVWKNELSSISESQISLIDFQNLFDNEDSNEYCYDTIHLNKKGMEKFSKALGDYLKIYLAPKN